MPEIPECMMRRYKVLDELIDELSARKSVQNSEADCSKTSENAGIKLMCDFWNILRDDPDCNLKREVQERMGLSTTSINSSFGPHKVTCYMSDGRGRSPCKKGNEAKDDASNKGKKPCCKSSEFSRKPSHSCCGSRPVSKVASQDTSLSKVLCTLKDAVSFDKKCNAKVTELVETQKRLQEQIQHLEHREKEGVKMLKEADCMWSCMEESYKKKVAESLERQKAILKELKLAEAEVAKWRKNKKDLESQFDDVNKCHEEIKERTNQKKNDIKCMTTEIEGFKKRIENCTKDSEAAKKSLSTKKQASDKIIAKINSDIADLQKNLAEEKASKQLKEQEGNQYIKEAREELQKICKVLLQKKLENEDLKAERDGIDLEIEMLRQTCDHCQDKCKKKQTNIDDEITKVEKEIADFKVKCIRCHECVDTADARKYCNDCPRCQEERDCIVEGGHCSADPSNECVCMRVKQKFMDNVFENMYTVLERQAKTRQGKCMAEAVMQCLKRSRNGKIDGETRNLLQEFILRTVRRNLNLTIVGGAVKTRCEMDPETHKQLMLCLKQVKVVAAPKVDKGTIAKKDPCRRWGGETECNCPGGPKRCVCSEKAPKPLKDPTPCPEDPDDKAENEKTPATECPHKDDTHCSFDCGRHGIDNLVETEVVPWVQDPCKDRSCPFAKNMRAAQCILGPERLAELKNDTSASLQKSMNIDDEEAKEKQRRREQDIQNHPRDRIIEEVLGRYTEVTPIEKVTFNGNQGKAKKRRYIEDYRPVKSKRLKHSKSSRVFTYAPVFVKSNRFCPLGISPNMKTIYVSKNCTDFWPSDETISYENSSDDINEYQNTIEFTLRPSEYILTAENEEDNFRNSGDKSFDICATEKSVGGSSILLFGRNVCKDVKEIVKEIIQFDLRAKNQNYSSSVELVTVKSLLKLLVTRNGPDESNVTINEKEVNCDLFSMKNAK